MRTYGRVYDEFGNPTWTEVTTDANGYNDAVWLTTLIQCVKLNINESPFHANYGINGIQSVVTQVFPDFYVFQLQSLFAPYFASVVISKLPSTTPTYNIAVTTNQGAKISVDIPT